VFVSLLPCPSKICVDTERREIALDPRGGGISPALIMQGLVPCSPWKPTAAITTRVLEVYRVAHARCPQLAIQAFVKTLCDLHGVCLLPFVTFAQTDLACRCPTDPTFVNSFPFRTTYTWTFVGEPRQGCSTTWVVIPSPGE
jgi:hypothetical protein